MRLTTKLTLAMVAGIVLTVTTTTVLRVQRERSLFVRDMARDQRMVGRVFAYALAAVWAAEGESRALWVVRVANRAAGPVRVRLASLDPRAPASRRPALEPEAFARAVAGNSVTEVHDANVTTVVPVPIATFDPRGLEITESLKEQRAYVRGSELWNGAEALALVLICGGLALTLGWAFVGKPMRALTSQARRIAAGDRTMRVSLRQNDEIAEFSSEMNAMCEQLDVAEKHATEQTAQRIAAVEQLRHADRLRTVGQLASGLAHELGTPLNVVSGRARLIEKGKRSREESADDARIIAEQAERMATLIRQLLDFARRRQPQREDRDLREVARECRTLLGQLAAKRGVTVEVVEPDTPVTARVDAAQIQQALTNLVVNGIHSMKEGGTLRIHVGLARARPPEASPGEELRPAAVLEVEDRGEGIAPEHLERVFEPFFTTKGVGEGTGLGLPVSHGLVRDHGGWITVESKPGHGSRFAILLPL